jgi:hypothetical protein
VAAVESDAAARLVSARGSLTKVFAYLLAGEAGVPLMNLWRGRLSPQERQRLSQAREQLEGTPLHVDAPNRLADVPGPDQVLGDEQLPRVLLVDDFDLWADGSHAAVLRRLSAFALDTACTVVVSVSAEALRNRGQPHSHWGRVPTMTLELTRPEFFGVNCNRHGENRRRRASRNQWIGGHGDVEV